MATAEQIRANRENAKKSTGPKSKEGKAKARFNGLKHGLRAEQVVIPGENPDDFEAERQAWFDDWKPMSHTRAVLVERAAVAAWRLRRCVRAEAARLHAPGDDAAHDFDLGARQRVEVALHLLPRDPAAALERLRADAEGLDVLIAFWVELAEAAEPGRWTSRADHHDRLLNLLGHPAGSDAEGLEAARASRVLLGRGAGRDADPAGAAASLRALCLGRIEELRRERSGCWDPPALRRRAIDSACAPASEEAGRLLRYEMAHEQSLRSSLRQLMALERSGADLPDEPSPGPEPEPEAAPEAPAEADAASTGTGEAESPAENPCRGSGCEKLASLVKRRRRGGRPSRGRVASGARNASVGAGHASP